MMVQILISLLATFIVASVALVVVTIIKTQLALRTFKLKSRGTIPLADDFRLISGHIISILFKPDLNNHLRRVFSKFGDIFFIMYGDKPFVFTIDLDLIKTMALDEQQININRTPLEIPIKELESDSIMLAGDDQWRRARRAIAPALKKSKFMTTNVQKEINDSIDKVIDSLERKLNESSEASGQVEVDADDFFHRYSLDLVLSCLYKQNNLIDYNSKHDQMTQVFELGLAEVLDNPFVYLPIVFPILGPLIDSYLLSFVKLGVLRNMILTFIKIQTKLNLEARKEIQSMKDAGKKDINEENLILKDGSKFNRNMIDHVIDHYHDGKLNKREYFHSSFFLFAAADKTSADAISHTLYRLALHKDKQDKLRESIQLAGEHSQYLDWVIMEALRLQPPVTIGCSRTVERDFVSSSGALIPKGTFVITPAYVIHRLEKYWGQDVDQFKPERFQDRSSFHPCQYIPFGAGLRQCPGKAFALYQMKLLLSKLIARYEFTCQPKKTEAFDAPFFTYIKLHENTVIRISRVRGSSVKLN